MAGYIRMLIEGEPSVFMRQQVCGRGGRVLGVLKREFQVRVQRSKPMFLIVRQRLSEQRTHVSY